MKGHFAHIGSFETHRLLITSLLLVFLYKSFNKFWCRGILLSLWLFTSKARARLLFFLWGYSIFLCDKDSLALAQNIFFTYHQILLNLTVTNWLFLLLDYNAALQPWLIFLIVVIDVIDFIQSFLCHLRDWIITLILSVAWLLFLDACASKHSNISSWKHINILQTIFITRCNLFERFFGVARGLKSWSFTY